MSTRAETLAYDLEAEVISHQVADEAAAELRRLYAEVETLRAAVKQARIDALEEAKTLIENYPFWLGTTAKAEIATAIESLKGTP